MAEDYASTKLTSNSPAGACIVAKTLAFSYQIGVTDTTKKNICIGCRLLLNEFPSGLTFDHSLRDLCSGCQADFRWQPFCSLPLVLLPLGVLDDRRFELVAERIQIAMLIQ